VSEAFLGEVRAFGFDFAPRGWARCDGQILPIAPNTALFSLLGTTYGGDGRTTFALPDLRGRVLVHAGAGPGLSPAIVGQRGGAEQVALTASQGPRHSHTVQASESATTNRPSGAVPGAIASTTVSGYASSGDGTTMNASMIATSGDGQAHENRQPYLVLNWCIALEGIYPSRS